MTETHQKLDLLLELGRFREALKLAREAVGREPEWANGYTQIARAYAGLGLARKAERAARLGVKKGPHDPWGYQVWALTLAKLGRHAEALDASYEASRLAPAWAGGFSTRAWLQNASGRYAQALRTTTEGLRLDPEHSGLLQYRALALFNLHRYGAAEAVARRGRGLHPDEPMFYNLIGSVEALRGRRAVFTRSRHFAAADAEFVAALRLNPSEPLYHRDRLHNARYAGRTAAVGWAAALFAAGIVVPLAAIVLAPKWSFDGLLAGWGAIVVPTAAIGLLTDSVMFTRPRRRPAMPMPLARWQRNFGRVYWACVWVTLAAGVLLATAAAVAWACD